MLIFLPDREINVEKFDNFKNNYNFRLLRNTYKVDEFDLYLPRIKNNFIQDLYSFLQYVSI